MFKNLLFYWLLLTVTLSLFIFPKELKADLDLTKNKEFILTFLPNYHNNWSSFNKSDSIYIFIYAAIPTKGTIKFKDIYDNDYSVNFDIPDPSVVYILKEPAYDFALRGYNLSGTISNSTHSEKVCDYSFKITADNPVQVYGHSQATMTSESFNVLPLESLGKEYLVLAYNANNDVGGNPDGRTPSQFAVVAVEDSTLVTITPSTATRYNGTKVQKITLNAGQVYLVQTSLESLYPDLTQSHILSTKPVAVFSGQQRARVPYNAQGGNVSRDYLAEQMPPIDSWSNEAIIVPFPKPSALESSNSIFDKLRIIAAYDNTELYVDNQLITTLNKAEVYESDLRFPRHFKASAPIMAAGYKRSSGLTGDNGSLRGDPLLQIIPTPGQYGESYRFITIQAYEGLKEVYDEDYIVIISEPTNIPTLLLDGNPLNPALFKSIEGSTYLYAHISIGNGTHEIKGDKAFGLFVCGYGYANSYGYFCGIVAKRDDYEPPVLQSSVKCFESSGNVTDKTLKSISAPAGFIINTSVTLENFKPYVTEAKFSAKLVNNYLDGKCRIIGVDSVGQQSNLDIEIPGFTVALISDLKNEDNINVSLLKDSLGVNEKKCYDFTVKNYGKFPQKVNGAKFLNNHPEITSDIPTAFELAPNEELKFQICFLTEKSNFITDSLFITGECDGRTILAVNLSAFKDENAPQVASFKDPCNQFLEFFITDSLKTDIGIDTVIVEEIKNLIFNIKKSTLKSMQITALVINPYKDSYLKVLVRDRQGNETEFERKLPGFTIDFNFIERTEDSSAFQFDFGRKMIGVRYCDSLRLKNYGENEIIFNKLNLSENIIFSIPPSQLPLTFKPGEEKNLRVCYLSNKSSSEILSDTLNLEFNCINEMIVLLGQPDSLKFDGDTKCDIPLVFEVAEVPNGAFVGSAYPNPSGGIINIDFNNPDNSNISIIIYNQLGGEEKTVIYNNLAKGYYTIPIDTGSLNNGYYNVLVSVGNDKFFRNMVILK